jgi:hypothetical protein
VQHVGIGPVEVDPFLDDCLIVVMQRQTGAIVDARTFKGAARLDLEHVVTAIPVFIDPVADGVTLIGRFDFLGGLLSNVSFDLLSGRLLISACHTGAWGAGRARSGTAFSVNSCFGQWWQLLCSC